MSAFSVRDFPTEASMATVRGSRFVTVLAVALGGFIVLPSDTSFGQEKHKISWSAKPENTKTTFRHRLEIPDILGHAIGMFEIRRTWPDGGGPVVEGRSEEHTSELQSRSDLVCRLLLEKKKKTVSHHVTAWNVCYSSLHRAY